MTKELIQEFANRKYPIVGDYQTKRYGNDRMNEYVVKSTADAIKLSDGRILGFDKPSIETRFCFHDEGPQYDLYKDLHSDNERMRAYFMHENLRRIDSFIEGLEVNEDIENKPNSEFIGFWDNENGTACLTSRWYCHITNCGIIEEGLKKHELEPKFTVATGADRLATLEMLKQIRATFVKRLETWWKKYGAEKLHTWTYWADA